MSSNYPHLWLDVVYIKVREGARTVSKAVLIAYGVNDEGQRDVLGLEVAESEMEMAWRHFIERLIKRELKGVLLVISDAHRGLKNAFKAVLNGVTWQRRRVHFMRNVLAKTPKKLQVIVLAALKRVFAQTSLSEARTALTTALTALREKVPAVAELVEAAEDDVLNYMAFPDKHWRQVHSTNPLERLNKESRRRTDVVGIFPNEAAVLRLITMILAERNDEWAVGRRYFSLESMEALKNARPKHEPLFEAA